MAIFKKASVTPIVRTVISQGIKSEYDVLNPLEGKDPGTPYPDFEKNILSYGATLLADLEGKYRDAIPAMEVFYLLEKMAEKAALLHSRK